MESFRAFDLNVTTVLEHWKPEDALREIIANAIDEQILSQTDDIQIFQDDAGCWHVRDFGRGLAPAHLVQEENEEKLDARRMIGQFGVGLKDALAVFHRVGIDVEIESRHLVLKLALHEKHSFDDLETLHALVGPARDPDFIGTDVKLVGMDAGTVTKAKDRFLQFLQLSPLDTMRQGQILDPHGRTPMVFINGVAVAQDPKFRFSYNITKITKAIRRALNRERNNVGRSAYRDPIIEMLTRTRHPSVLVPLADALRNDRGQELPTELQWIDVRTRVHQFISSTTKTLFVTAKELETRPADMDLAKRDGLVVQVVTEQEKKHLLRELDDIGAPVRTLEVFRQEYADSFTFQWVRPSELTPKERAVFDATDDILALIGGRPSNVSSIRISEELRPEDGQETSGCWIPARSMIIVKRSELSSIESYAGILLHEAAHAVSGRPDVDRDFENHLTTWLGKLAADLVASHKNK